jgi:hypothetical protein
MKKIRMIVGAFAVLAVVGSALAFSPKNQTFCHYQIDENGACPLINKPTTFTQLVPAGNEWAQQKVGGVCPATVNANICTHTYSLTFNQ